MRQSVGWAWLLVWLPVAAWAEPPVSTTAIQAERLALWWVWWSGLAVFSFVAYPLLAVRTLRAHVALAGVAGALAFLCGAALIILMFVVSIAWSKTSPWWFIGAWVAVVAAMTAVLLAIARKRSPHAGP